MTEDQCWVEFHGIVFASYRLDERELLKRLADSYVKCLPYADEWVMSNLPDYLFEAIYEFVERLETIVFARAGWFDFEFCNINLRELTELTEGGEND